MTKDLPSMWSAWIGIFAVCALVGGLMLFRARRKKRRGERPPVETLLLRPAGYSLQMRLFETDEKATNDFFNAVILAALLSILSVYLSNAFFNPQLREWFAGHGGYSAMFKGKFLPVTLSALLACVGLGLGVIYWVTKCVSRLEKVARLRLGLRGEQAVAEAVSELVEQGWRIFHDLPGGKDWNIDHVAVGPGGVFALETKTRSKRTAPPGVKDHEVIYDGKSLRFPWGEDNGAVPQATANARWLAEFLTKATGMPVQVFPVIVVPGWYVVGKGNFTVQAMNARYLTKYLGRLARSLSASEVQRIAHQVGQKCRDLEF